MRNPSRGVTDRDREPGVIPLRPWWMPAPGTTPSGESRHFGRLLDERLPRLVRYAEHFVDRDTAEDIVQSAVVAFWEVWAGDGGRRLRSAEAAGVEPDAGDELGLDVYLHRSVRARLLNAQRDRRRLQSRLGEHLRELESTVRRWMSQESEQEARDLMACLGRLVQALPPRSREVFLLTRGQYQRCEEAARELGISANTVRAHRLRACRALREGLLTAGFGLGTTSARVEESDP